MVLLLAFIGMFLLMFLGLEISIVDCRGVLPVVDGKALEPIASNMVQDDN